MLYPCCLTVQFHRILISFVVATAIFGSIAVTFRATAAPPLASERPALATVNDNGLVFRVPLDGATDVSELLLQHNITLSEHDELFPPLVAPINGGSVIHIHRATRVIVHDFQGSQQDHTLLTHGSSVRDALTELGIELSSTDTVDPPLSSALYSDLEVDVIRVSSDSLTKTTSIPFGIIERNNPTLLRGKRVVQRDGVAGTKVLSYALTYKNDVLVEKVLVSEEVTEEPVDQIVLRGTKSPVQDTQSGRASWYSAPSLTAAHKTYPLGSKVRVINASTGAAVTVTIADRGPYVDGRIIDLSRDAFASIASLGAGTVSVRIELLAQ